MLRIITLYRQVSAVYRKSKRIYENAMYVLWRYRFVITPYRKLKDFIVIWLATLELWFKKDNNPKIKSNNHIDGYCEDSAYFNLKKF